MKGVRATKNAKEVTFEGVWGELEFKKGFLKTIIHKIFGSNSSFSMK